MKHDSLNLTAPHTLRELAQADTEAGAMHAKQIATMIAEDGYLDRGEAGNPISGVNKARAILAEWLNTPSEGDPMVDCLLAVIAEAHAALVEFENPATGQPVTLNLSGWIDRRKQLIGPYADHIVKGVASYEAEIGRLRKLDAEYGRVEAAIIIADPDFDGDSDHANCGDRLIASISRLSSARIGGAA